MRLPSSSDSEQTDPDLTPVIDVVFLLLIFFLVATRFDQQERELNLALPEVVAAQPLSMTEDLIINVTEEGKYKIVQKVYSKEKLDALLAQESKKNPHKKVMVRADGRADWRFVADVASRCDKYKLEHKEAVIKEKG